MNSFIIALIWLALLYVVKCQTITDCQQCLTPQVAGSPTWCGCCALNCGNTRARCDADGFCSTLCTSDVVCTATTESVASTTTEGATTTTEVIQGTTTEETPAPTTIVDGSTTEMAETTTIEVTSAPPPTTMTTIPPSCVLTNWGDWSECPKCTIDGGSVPPGQSPFGVQTRTRTITTMPPGVTQCNDELIESRECNTDVPDCLACYTFGMECNAIDDTFPCCGNNVCVSIDGGAAGICRVATTTQITTTTEVIETTTTEVQVPRATTTAPIVVPQTTIVRRGDPCTSDKDCAEPLDLLICIERECSLRQAQLGDPCQNDGDCAQPLKCLVTGVPQRTTCSATLPIGSRCGSDRDCNSGFCNVNPERDGEMICGVGPVTITATAVGNLVSQEQNDLRLGLGIALGLCCCCSVLALACFCQRREDRQGSAA